MSLRIAEPSASEESVHPAPTAAAAAAASDMQRRRRALIGDRQPRLTRGATLARFAAGIT